MLLDASSSTAARRASSVPAPLRAKEERVVVHSNDVQSHTLCPLLQSKYCIVAHRTRRILTRTGGATKTKMEERRSVVVIGAGLAGLRCAQLLKPHYPDVLVVEASAEGIGGRLKQVRRRGDLVFSGGSRSSPSLFPRATATVQLAARAGAFDGARSGFCASTNPAAFLGLARARH